MTMAPVVGSERAIYRRLALRGLRERIPKRDWASSPWV